MVASFLAAASSKGVGGNSMIIMIAVYAVIFVAFYMIAIRPQSKQRKQHDELLASLEVGDSILTSAGFFGVVIDIMDEIVIVEFGNNKNCRIPMKKESIVEIDKQSSKK